VRDIQAHLLEIYEVEVSPDLISRTTDAALEEVNDWQAARSTAVYPVIFLDAIVCKVRDNGSVRNKAAHVAVGIDVDGRKEVSVRSNLRVRFGCLTGQDGLRRAGWAGR
jgi:putative transposase